MSERKTIVKNMISMLFMRVLTPATTFLLFIYLSRKLGPFELGKYSFVMAVFQITQSLPLLGLNTYAIREVAREKSTAGQFMTNLSFIGVILAIVLSIFLYFGSSRMSYPSDVIFAVGILGFAIVAGSVSMTGEAVMVGAEKIHQMAVIGVIENLLKTIFSFLGVWLGFGLFYLILILGLSRLFSAVSYLLIVDKNKFSLKNFIPDFSFCRKILKACPVFFGIGLFATLLNRLDFLMLSKMRSFDELGFYTAAYRILEICILLSSTFIFSVFPVMSRLYHESPEKLKTLTEKAVKYLFLFLMFLTLVIFAFADKLILLFYNTGYEPSIRALRILIPTALLLGLDQIFAGVLLAGNYQNLDLKVVLISSVGYFFLLLILIPLFGMYGAGVATFLAALLQVAIRYWYLAKRMIEIDVLRIVWKPFAAGFAVISIVLLLGKISWLINLPLAVLAYFTVLILIGVLDRSDLALISNLKGRGHEAA